MNHSLYLHIPFCTHRCAYCDFNTYAGQEDSIGVYVAALVNEIEFVGSHAPERIAVHTVFFGGGTPSLFTSAQFKSILDAIRRHFDLKDDAEITTEANPGTVSRGEMQALRDLGVNRISFGVQSANSEELRMLERAHNYFDVLQAVTLARKAGFDNLNLDLIYGLPEQSLESWRTTVQRILDLHPEHISAYALTLEHGTPFGRWAARGLMASPDPDLAAEMYEWTSEAFEAAGYVQYEISNWARDGEDGVRHSVTYDPSSYACKHNLQYWRALPYLGVGAGAHGYANGHRYSNVLRIKTYIDRLGGDHSDRDSSRSTKINSTASRLEFPLSPAAVNQHRQTIQDDISEFMITGLRLTREGIRINVFQNRFGRELSDVYPREIEELTSLGLLELIKTSEVSMTSEVLRLTKRGRLLGNQVFMRFL